MLPRNRRLSRRDLNVCNLSGKTLRFPNFWLKYLANNLEYSRFAVVTSTKLSKSAVVRNKLRRNIYAQCSVLSAQGSDNFDIIFFPQKSMLNLKNEKIGIVVNQALSEISH